MFDTCDAIPGSLTITGTHTSPRPFGCSRSVVLWLTSDVGRRQRLYENEMNVEFKLLASNGTNKEVGGNSRTWLSN